MPEPTQHHDTPFGVLLHTIIGIFSSFFAHLPTWDKILSTIILSAIGASISFAVMAFWKAVFKKRRGRYEK